MKTHRFRLLPLLAVAFLAETVVGGQHSFPQPSSSVEAAGDKPSANANNKLPLKQEGEKASSRSTKGTLASPESHPVTVADSIRMTRLGDPLYTAGASSKGLVAQFSPDGKQFTVVLKKGNLEQNTVEYSLLLFKTAQAFQSPRPEILLTLASSSNRPAISAVNWLDDNQTIAFLGEHPGELQQLYTIRCSTKELKKLTNQPTNLVSYSTTARGDPVAFVAEPLVGKVLTSETRREGVSISTQWLPDLIAGRYSADLWLEPLLFLKRHDTATTKRLQSDGAIRNLSLSPDGRYLVFESQVLNVPEDWSEYQDQMLEDRIHQKLPKGVPHEVYAYTLVDTATGKSQPLLDAPEGFWGSEFAWAPDSRSLVLAGTYLPLDITDAVERKARQSSTFVAEIRIPSREIVKFPQKDLKLLKWNKKTNKVLFEIGRIRTTEGAKVAYRKTGSNWREVETTAADLSASNQLDVILEEDLNTSPKIVAIDPQTGRKALLLDLNPQFKQLNFGKVEAITWKATDGHEVQGGLYRPPDFVPGKRYPLVIQTHGFTPEKFWIDGPWPTAFAAQELAGKGFVVLQVGYAKNLEDDVKDTATPQEATRETAAYEGAIDYLDSIGLIDRNRVGITGFSRTCFYVKYTLTHSKYAFAAAVVADGIDAGYLQYMALANANAELALEFEKMNGGLPFADGMATWLRLSPSFGLEKVHTPLRIQAIQPTSVLGEWEWFAGLTRLGEPVDMVYLPEGTHILEKPWERLVSQQGDVDWFCFWLNGEEYPDPAKASQYARWRGLREQRFRNEEHTSAH